MFLDTTLPQEITDRIIDDLREFPETLKSSALVCSQWLPRSRWNMFRSISFVDKHLNIHVHASSLRRMFGRLLACLQGSPELGALVEELTMDCGGKTDLAISFIANLHLFPHLRVLYIRRLSLPRELTALADRMSLDEFGHCIAKSAIGNLQSLTLNSVFFPGAYLLRLLDEAQLHNLSYLELCMVQAYDYDFLADGREHLPSLVLGTLAPPVSGLRTLKVYQVSSAMQALLIRFGVHLRGLQTLSYNDKNATLLDEILQNCRHSLETLEVGLYPGMLFK